MVIVAIVASAILALVAVEQIAAIAFFVRYCRAYRAPRLATEPEVLVVLPVRGADETLADCVDALLQQDYSNYCVRIVLDSRDDPGWQIVERVRRAHPGAPIEVLELVTPSPNCSLKCSAVCLATDELDDCEVIALLDTDVVPHRSWLRELVAPLADEQVGASCGNRWYLPSEAYWGSLVRYAWNTAAMVSMHFWGIPWGGTMAVRRQLLAETDIRDRWRRAGCEDVPLVPVLRAQGLRTQFVPSLIMVNRGDVSLPECLQFVDRQLLWVRLYYPLCWWICNGWQAAIAAAFVAAAACGFIALASGTAWLFGVSCLAIAVASAVSSAMIRMTEKTLLPDARGPAVTRPLRTLIAVLATNVIMVRAIAVSLLTRAVRWRGVDYRINGPWNVQLQEYRPFAPPESPTATAALLQGAESHS